jgi:hypothetical protein
VPSGYISDSRQPNFVGNAAVQPSASCRERSEHPLTAVSFPDFSMALKMTLVTAPYPILC